MSTEDKKTDNELIAEFMGLERTKSIWDKGEYAYTIKFESFGYFNKWVIPSDMEFHKSWDWLMPVVEKINKLEDDNKLRGFDLDIIRSMHDWISSVKILNAYADAVTIIKWHNTQPK